MRDQATARIFRSTVTLRIVEGMSSLAREGLMEIIRRAIKQSQKSAFKVHEFNVLGNHLHPST
jgi:hypothetical protein